MDILIKGGMLATDRKVVGADILVKDGRIAAVEPNITLSGIPVFDTSGCVVTPGLVDLHVHFRQPGFEQKETILTGCRAATAGGYTLVCPMPNLNPVPDSPENLEVELEAIRKDALVDVRPYCSITKGRLGRELVDMEALSGSCVGFSDDGSGVQSEQMMLQAMTLAAENDCIIAAHCEDNALLNGGYIHDGAYCAAHSHKGICSESEWGQIARDLELAAKTHCRYHVCHISTKESVELIRKAKAAGVKVTCETAPHYLVLCEDDLQEDGRFKMNPPLRSARDRKALLEGLADGTIDAIATDHAPHTAEQKSRGLQGSAMGVVGLETAFPVLFTALYEAGKIPLPRIVEALTSSPRRIFGLGGEFAVGAPADIAVFENKGPYTIDPDTFLSKGRSTPFAGMKVSLRIKQTFKDGKALL